MKRYCFFFAIIIGIFYAHKVCAQEIFEKHIAKLEIVNQLDKDGIEMPFEDDIEFSKNSVAWIINNNIFIKSNIGIDSVKTVNSLFKEEDFPLIIRKINSKGDSIIVNAPPSPSSPLVINGISYSSLAHATVCGSPKMLTIPEICHKYTDAPMSKTVVLVNGVNLLKDIASYKIAERYILRVDVVPSKDIEGCVEDFTIIKIYTRTSINKKRQFMRLGLQ